MFFKLTDVKYKKTHDITKIKKVFGKKEDFKLAKIFGIPESITNLTVSEMLSHVDWIEKVCAENNIEIHSSKWDSIISYLEEREII